MKSLFQLVIIYHNLDDLIKKSLQNGDKIPDCNNVIDEYNNTIKKLRPYLLNFSFQEENIDDIEEFNSRTPDPIRTKIIPFPNLFYYIDNIPKDCKVISVNSGVPVLIHHYKTKTKDLHNIYMVDSNNKVGYEFSRKLSQHNRDLIYEVERYMAQNNIDGLLTILSFGNERIYGTEKLTYDILKSTINYKVFLDIIGIKPYDKDVWDFNIPNSIFKYLRIPTNTESKTQIITTKDGLKSRVSVLKADRLEISIIKKNIWYQISIKYHIGSKAVTLLFSDVYVLCYCLIKSKHFSTYLQIINNKGDKKPFNSHPIIDDILYNYTNIKNIEDVLSIKLKDIDTFDDTNHKFVILNNRILEFEHLDSYIFYINLITILDTNEIMKLIDRYHKTDYSNIFEWVKNTQDVDTIHKYFITTPFSDIMEKIEEFKNINLTEKTLVTLIYNKLFYIIYNFKVSK